MEFDQIVADFRVEGRLEMEKKLDAAVRSARRQAGADRRRGVLVTRHDFDHFSVSLTPRVPFGFTQELDHAGRI
ncbi:hypothetical protein KNN17_21480 [Arthrobacter bambusae]|uniref:hypothetical protein n=1 Tax=Arthrobacter bambusae TaxID=1338426 RepID=UPI001F50B0BD|nr:hypothetical protein [Arthrobacter bambusae]MCI0144124.1 hypothetical protein [Arthrobacter bambusae]